MSGAKLELSSRLTSDHRLAVSDSSGTFEFQRLPYGAYQITTSAPGFEKHELPVLVRTNIPVSVGVTLALTESKTAVNIESRYGGSIEISPTSRADTDRDLMDKLPIRNQATGLSEIISNTAAGVASDGNGFFHPLGEHADTAMSLDGQPINDQQAKIFTNQISVNTIETMEVISGAPPPEFGGKTSLVINVVTRSGLGQQKPTGSLSAQYGSFGTWSQNAAIGMGNHRWGNFLAANSSGSGRFLDTPEFRPLHAKGNSQSVFDRIDFQPTDRDSLHLNLNLGRSWFQTPNSYDADAVRQDQRSQIRSLNIAGGWTHILSPALLLNVNPFFRLDQSQYFPTADRFSDLSATVGQNRRLNNMGLRSDLSYSRGIHTAKFGGSYWLTRLRETFDLGVTDPSFNPVCLDSIGDAVTDPHIVNPATCTTQGYQPNPDLIPGIVPFDLTRGGRTFPFDQHATVHEAALYAQDSVALGRLSLNGGIRFDRYSGFSTSHLLQPRFGMAYKLNAIDTVLRASYARLFETPYNENLILASGSGPDNNPFGTFRTTAVKTGTRNQFNAGLAQRVGTRIVIDADYFWKFTENAFDFSALFNSPITFPIMWRKSKIDGAAVSVNVAPVRGISVNSVMGHVRSRFFGPQTGGLIFTSQPGSGVFRIDHAEEFQQTTHIRYQPKKDSPWVALTWRYNSGLALPGVSPDYESALQLTGDEQAQMGLYCGGIYATVQQPLRSCLGPRFGATRVRIPAPGTQNDDTNPTRVMPRHLFDVSAGIENLFRGDRYRVTLHGSVVNIGNRVALYNFLSTFSGTHFVTPRAYQVQLGFVF